ncbi:hypothetical protein G3I59_36070 [Amycolatopsis rubida]|uniref:Uncharacterized protein n=1 Tax=Amycolatopsis rubida TaxID=112413 RepID=A0ABX0BZN3_9PSEU|nr:MULTISPECIES: hypothetical protein [Amycolatopsis]MYW94899.1 hypothetical protein [Amycolatopsis rubida]MYW95881.1 hypothetical protein [Amycolatopsis rubida]NEC59886.1 hypothetical protein [Amycolatopsis rubida]NEC60871.1 hypothetical protein [Amycolatopsis rubida]
MVPRVLDLVERGHGELGVRDLGGEGEALADFVPASAASFAVEGARLTYTQSSPAPSPRSTSNPAACAGQKGRNPAATSRACDKPVTRACAALVKNACGSMPSP